MAVQDEHATVPADPDPDAGAPRKAMTIGAVCKALEQEFPDISISKIRYLEDQKLVAPRRTPGGYRLYSAGDVQRLRTILRLQRDEFLPLRVIRQELASGRAADDVAPTASASDGEVVISRVAESVPCSASLSRSAAARAGSALSSAMTMLSVGPRIIIVATP